MKDVFQKEGNRASRANISAVQPGIFTERKHFNIFLRPFNLTSYLCRP